MVNYLYNSEGLPVSCTDSLKEKKKEFMITITINTR